MNLVYYINILLIFIILILICSILKKKCNKSIANLIESFSTSTTLTNAAVPEYLIVRNNAEQTAAQDNYEYPTTEAECRELAPKANKVFLRSDYYCNNTPRCYIYTPNPIDVYFNKGCVDNNDNVGEFDFLRKTSETGFVQNYGLMKLKVPATTTTQQPTTTQSPIITQAPTITQPPIITQTPTITQLPIITQAPIITNRNSYSLLEDIDIELDFEKNKKSVDVKT